jgi:two-component system, NtrC family, nitrogen regulation sensor histidine kinase GlnL
LTICHKIVSEHRGMIKAESDPGRGTKFTVLLPLVR